MIEYFMGGKAILPKKRKLCDIDSQDLDESTDDSIEFETARVKYTFILRLTLPFLKEAKALLDQAISGDTHFHITT